MDKLYKFLGYRKLGAIDDDRTVFLDEIKLEEKESKEYVNLSGGHIVDQGRVGSCACCTLVGLVIDQVIAKTHNKSFWIEWKPIWEDMKRLGIASDKEGSYLVDNLWYLKEKGFKSLDGKTYKAKKIARINDDEIEKALLNDFQIYSGAGCGFPFIDKNFFWNIIKKVFGHSFRICGISINKGWIAETTWRFFGWRKQSQFFIRFGNEKEMFQKYIIEIEEVQ